MSGKVSNPVTLSLSEGEIKNCYGSTGLPGAILKKSPSKLHTPLIFLASPRLKRLTLFTTTASTTSSLRNWAPSLSNS